jgi:hypothetical protein
MVIDSRRGGLFLLLSQNTSWDHFFGTARLLKYTTQIDHMSFDQEQGPKISSFRFFCNVNDGSNVKRAAFDTKQELEI